MTFCAPFTGGSSPRLTEAQIEAIYRHLVASAN
jgi:hypothetical protein